MIKCSRTLLILIVVWVVLFASQPTYAISQVEPPEILSSRLSAKVAPESDYRVSVTYEVKGTRSVDSLPLQALQVFGASIKQVKASVNGASTSRQLLSDRPPLLTGSVDVPPVYRRRDTLSLQLEYRVTHNITSTSDDRFEVTIPLLYINHAPTATADSTFFARIELPANFVVTDRFPVLIADVLTADRIKHYEFALQVLPAYVRLKGTTGDESIWLTVNRAVDLGIIGLSILGGVLVWMRFRWVRRETKAKEQT
mgnify:CR=1 FL=1